MIRIAEELGFMKVRAVKTYRITDMRKAKTKKKARRAWTKDEVKLLNKLYPDGGAGEIAERIGRPLTAVRQKAYYMGIRTREYHFWKRKIFIVQDEFSKIICIERTELCFVKV